MSQELMIHLDAARHMAAAGSRQRFIIAQALMARGLTRIGVASSFVHVDVDKGKDQQVMWLYD